MKFACSPAVFVILGAAVVAQLPSGRQEPFVAAGVSYRAALARDRDRTASDVGAMRTLGFNLVRVSAPWSDLEPARGQYRLDDVDRVLELAGRAELRVIVRLETASPPAWLLTRYRDSRYLPAAAAERTPRARACFDHPGVRADVEAFISAVVSRAASHAAFQAVDVGSDLDGGFCLCPHTARRFREWTTATFGSALRPAAERGGDRAAFVTVERRDHLALLGAATAARGPRLLTTTASLPTLLQAPGSAGGQDDWLMSRVVDRYGAMVEPQAGRAGITAARLAMGLDGVRGAAGANGWLASHATQTAASEMRLWTWAAILRGARGVVFGEWRGVDANADGLADSGDRLEAAAALSRVIGRNPALFAPLRPRRARVAIAYDPRSGAATADLGRAYEALFARSIVVDVRNIDEFATGAADGYALVFSGRTPSVEAIVRAATDVGVAPEVRIAGATGVVEARFLESADVLMLIGLNYADTPQRVTMTFPGDTQEAIWQNMETGAAVNFIAGPEGPTYTHTFAPKGTLVLMIRKGIR